MKKRFILIFCMIAMLLLCLCKVVFAVNSDLLQSKKDDLQAQIDAASDSAEEINIELTDALRDVNDLEEKISSYQVEINDLNLQISDLQAQINDAENKLLILEQNYGMQKTAFENRIVAQYEAGEMQYLDVLLHSNSLSEFVSNYFLISEIAEYDTELLNTIEQNKNSITTIKKTLSEQQEAIKQYKYNQEKTAIVLENTKAIKDNYVKKLSQEELEIQKQIDELKTELSNLEYDGGELLWPLPRSSYNNIFIWI